MYLAFSAKILTFYPYGTEVPIPELPGWTASKPTGREVYTIKHNLNVADPTKIKVTGIALEDNITVNVANIAANTFSIMAQRNGDEYKANFMFVLVVKP